MLFRRRTFLLLAGSLTLLIIARPTPGAFYAALPFIVVGELIRIWSAGYLTKLSGLVTAGPFALCRNPLYVGSFLISLGYLIMCHNLIALIAGVIVFWLLHVGAVVYEERLLREHFGGVFEAYCRRVPRFVPRLRSLAGDGSFSLQRAMGNDEFRSAAFTMLFASFFGLLAFESFSIINWLSGLTE